AADLGDERVVVAGRERNSQRLADGRLVLATELRGHRVVRGSAVTERLLADGRDVAVAGLERRLRVRAVFLIDLRDVVHAELAHDRAVGLVCSGPVVEGVAALVGHGDVALADLNGRGGVDGTLALAVTDRLLRGGRFVAGADLQRGRRVG